MVPFAYVFCASTFENSWLIFLGCGFAKNCWRAVGFTSIIYNLASFVNGFTQWLFVVINSMKEPVLSKIMMILWIMWQEINERLWNNVQRPPSLVTLHGIAYLYEWVQIKEKNYVSQTPWLVNLCSKWHPPPQSLLKCNCDAYVLYDSSELGLGATLGDDMGAFIAYKGLRLPRLPTVKEGEALALFEAMTWVHSTGYSMVIFKIDCKEVVDALCNTPSR